ncbi:MAG TPA: GGDEF domain-containing protein [Isosphaeraceae bacterium]|jgi:diguanylate cyclase (GGDEF)-like protein|nr:GGDEF domain-containing protein [Isosphaeraceae bacterium]
MDDNGATYLCDLLQGRAQNPPDADPPRGLPIYLIVLSGGIPGAMLRLGRGATRLGRGVDNVIQLPESSISRHHAALKADDDGHVRLVDLGSTNGTYLNGERVAPHTPILLRDGDRIRFGAAVVVKFARPDPCEEQFQREMFERTVRDALTGLYNRAFFLDQVGPLARRGARRGLGTAALMLDVDHFKRVNDGFGHDVGDAVLREVADVLRHSTRAEDLVARYGGEEFVVALPIGDADQATGRADRIRRDLAARRIVAEGHQIRVTASIGLAFFPADRPVAGVEMISAADVALYRAKAGGRDRVVGLAETPDPKAPAATSVDLDVDWRGFRLPSGL